MRVAELRLTHPGYAVVYADGGGAPGTRLGVSDLLETGEHRDVNVPIATTTSGRVFVMVHGEDNGNRSLDFPGADAPVPFGDGVLTLPVQIEVTR